MWVVGLTGGIGAGKTTVSDMFASLGICVVDTDLIARHVVAVGSEALQRIESRFGKEVIQHDGSLMRKKLREIIFASPPERRWLEALLHPLIREETGRQLEAADSAYTILSSPLLLESPDAERVDRILVVDAPQTQQIVRTGTRDGVDNSQIEKTIESQMSRKQRLDMADDIIDNSGSLEHTHQQVLALHQQYLKLSQP